MLKTKLDDLKSVITDSFAYATEKLDKRTLDTYNLEISVDESTQIYDKSAIYPPRQGKRTTECVIKCCAELGIERQA